MCSLGGLFYLATLVTSIKSLQVLSFARPGGNREMPNVLIPENRNVILENHLKRQLHKGTYLVRIPIGWCKKVATLLFRLSNLCYIGQGCMLLVSKCSKFSAQYMMYLKKD